MVGLVLLGDWTGVVGLVWLGWCGWADVTGLMMWLLGWCGWVGVVGLLCTLTVKKYKNMFGKYLS